MTRPRVTRTSPRVSLRQALSDPRLLGTILEGPSWDAWKVLLIASMGESLDDSERAIFRELTGRVHEPNQRVEEFAGVIGRRGGKSRAISVLATYIAGLCDHPALVAGEVGVVLCVAADQDQAAIEFDYISAAFDGSPILRQLVVSRTADTLRLRNHVEVQVRAASFRRLRGPSYVCVIAGELSFWMTSETSSNPDVEILAAIRPGLATTNGPLFMISSPYARRGELWNTYRRHYGPQGDAAILVAQGTSRQLNPTLPQRLVDRAYERDPASAAAEYGAMFRTDIEAFVSLESVQACVARGVYERPPKSNITYYGFVDPSGGSSDSFTLAIAHKDVAHDSIILDCVREARPPFSPESVTAEFATVLKTYGITTIVGDRYAGEWPREQFAKFGITYSASAKVKSDLYVDCLPVINSRRVILLDHPKLVSQFVGLERRTSRSGKDQIDHAPSAHDDLCNVAAGVCSLITTQGAWNLDGFQPEYSDAGESRPLLDPDAAWRNSQFWLAVMAGALDRG
jgi:hypothetical protein